MSVDIFTKPISSAKTLLVYLSVLFFLGGCEAVDINELDPEEVDVLSLNDLEDVFLGHGRTPLTKVFKMTVLTGFSAKNQYSMIR